MYIYIYMFGKTIKHGLKSGEWDLWVNRSTAKTMQILLDPFQDTLSLGWFQKLFTHIYISKK